MPALRQRLVNPPERRAVASVTLRLPVPPSANALYSPRKGGGLRLSDTYSRWLTDAGWRLQQQRPGRIAGPYVLTLHLPDASKLDLDNAIAGVSDLLQGHHVIDNDRLAEETHLYWHGGSDDLLADLVPFVGPARRDRVANIDHAEAAP